MGFQIQKFLATSKRLKRTADHILSTTKLSRILNKFGIVKFHGGYAADLLMNGDIDIYVIGKSFSKEKVLEIFNTIVRSTTFNSYWLADYKKFTHKRGIFPNAYYIGLRTRIKNEKWKIDIWFLTKKGLKNIKYHSLEKNQISQEQKFAILKLKNWRNQYNKKISGYHIYEAVLENKIKTINQFKDFLKKRHSFLLRF